MKSWTSWMIRWKRWKQFWLKGSIKVSMKVTHQKVAGPMQEALDKQRMRIWRSCVSTSPTRWFSQCLCYCAVVFFMSRTAHDFYFPFPSSTTKGSESKHLLLMTTCFCNKWIEWLATKLILGFRLTYCGSRSSSISRPNWVTSQPHPNRWVWSWNANSSTWIILCRSRLSNFMAMTLSHDSVGFVENLDFIIV